MKLSDAEVTVRVTAANKRLVAKTWFMGATILALFALCVVFTEQTELLARWVAQYVPSIEKLLRAKLEIGSLPARFFSACVVVLPMFLISWLWHEDPQSRVRYGMRRTGRGWIESIVVGYLLFFPACCFALFVALVAPFDMPNEPRLWGQHLLYLMLNTYWGLLLLGTTFVAAMAVFALLVAFFCWLPFFSLFRVFFRGEK